MKDLSLDRSVLSAMSDVKWNFFSNLKSCLVYMPVNVSFSSLFNEIQSIVFAADIAMLLNELRTVFKGFLPYSYCRSF